MKYKLSEEQQKKLAERRLKLGKEIESVKIEYVTKAVFITPAMADYILETFNDHNRDKDAVKSYIDDGVKEVIDGVFVHTPHGLVFHDDGSFADGQCRLTIISMTGVGQWMQVTYNMPKYINQNGKTICMMSKIDNGAVRSAVTNLSLAGVKLPGKFAPVARAIAILANNGKTARLNEQRMQTIRSYYGASFNALYKVMNARTQNQYTMAPLCLYHYMFPEKALELAKQITTIQGTGPAAALWLSYLPRNKSKSKNADEQHVPNKLNRALAVWSNCIFGFHTNSNSRTIQYHDKGWQWLLDLNPGIISKVKKLAQPSGFVMPEAELHIDLSKPVPGRSAADDRAFEALMKAKAAADLKPAAPATPRPPMPRLSA